MSNILAALDDPTLFRGLLDGPSWQPWKAALASLFALPMDDAQLALYRRHTGRVEQPAAPFREAAFIVGRRGGKSRVLATCATYLATVPDYSPHLAPGEVPVVAIIAADRKQARVILSYISGLLHSVPALEAMILDELAERVTLSNGTAIEVHTGSIGAPRGRTFIAVLADELAFWASGDSANPDREIVNAVRPGLATFPNSMLLMASSPYARRGVLFDTFSRYYGKDNAPVLVWRATTREMNSKIDPRIIEEAFAADPESAEAEYGANFRTDISAFIGRDAVAAVVADGVLEVPPAAGVPYVAFTDPSGGSADSMTLAISHMDPNGIAVLDAVRERKPPFSPEDVTAEFAELLKSYGITRVTGDAYAGEWPRERFATHGISYEVSSRNKSNIYQDFLPALNGRRVRLLDQPRLIAQLCNLERRVSRGGRDSIDHGPGQHDDVANAVCGALTLVINDHKPTLIPKSDIVIETEPTSLDYVATCFATIWVNGWGKAAAAFFAHSPFSRPPLALVDFDEQPWSGGLLPAVAQRLDALCEQMRDANEMSKDRGVSARLFVPGQLEALGVSAMRDAFGERLERFDATRRLIDVVPIDAALVQDPARLAFEVSALVSGGKVRITADAEKKSEHFPLFAALAVRPGEQLDDFPMRAALLVGIRLLGEQPSHAAPMLPAASITLR